FLRSSSRPNHKWERLKIVLTSFKRSRKQHFHLPTCGFSPTGKKQRLPVHYRTLLLPKVEMPHQQFFIDERKQPHDFIDLRLCHFDVESAAEMQCLEIFRPRKRDVVI